MFSQSQLEAFLAKIMDNLNSAGTGKALNNGGSGGDGNGGGSGQGGSSFSTNLTPSEILVLLGIFGGVLSVNSILINNAQQVQILLTGSLKRKTELDKMLDAAGSKTFDEVMNAIVDRYA